MLEASDVWVRVVVEGWWGESMACEVRDIQCEDLR